MKWSALNPFGQYFVEFEQSRGIISPEKVIHQHEAVLVVQNVQVFQYILVFHIRSAESYGLVEYCKGVPHRTVCLVGYDMERFIINAYILFCSYVPEVPDDVLYCNPVEIVCLASGQDGREYLMFFGSGQNEYRMRRRFFQGLQKALKAAWESMWTSSMM